MCVNTFKTIELCVERNGRSVEKLLLNLLLLKILLVIFKTNLCRIKLFNYILKKLIEHSKQNFKKIHWSKMC